jgi:acyl-CoA dehydrogenase
MIKVAAPRLALKIIDDAIQAHGGGGVTTDFGLAKAYAGIRTLRLADGPDEVHQRTIARMEYGKYGDLVFKQKAEKEAAMQVPGIR